MKDFLAALIFFTRLPLWRCISIPSDSFSRVVCYWSYAGWLTGGITAIVLWLASAWLPLWVAATLALSARILFTGALHEDGLADFADGFGGGADRDSILAIMKDSHIGTFGVLTLILYVVLFIAVLSGLSAANIHVACLVTIAADAWSKMCAGRLIDILPYARPEGAKNKISYSRSDFRCFIISLVGGVIPAVFLPRILWWSALAPILVVSLMILYLRKKIGGYTGDCCGATALIAELAFLLTALALLRCIGI